MKIFEDIKANTMCIASRAKNKNKDSHTQGHCTKTHSWKNKSLSSLVYPKYKLIEDLVHYILSRYNVHNGLRGNNKFFEQVLMFLRAVAHQEPSLHGVEVILSLDLCRG